MLNVLRFSKGQLSKERSSRTQASSLTAELESRLSSLYIELERSREKEEKATLDNRQLNERVSALEKEAASLTLELKAAQARYNQEVAAHQETERSRILSKEEANMEVVKGEDSRSPVDLIIPFFENILSTFLLHAAGRIDRVIKGTN